MNKKQVRWVIAHEPIDLFLRAAERFTKSVKEQTNGELDIEILSLTEYSEKYNGGKKVTKHDLLQLMEDGVVEASQMYTTWLGHYNKDMFVLDMPFLFRDHEHADRVLEGEIGEYLLKGLEQSSAVRGLAFTYSGGFRIIPAQKELATVEAFRGTKIRTARSPVAVDTFKALGAEVIDTIELEEMNDAVKAGVIEAGESTFVRVIPLKQNEAFGIVNDTAHSLFLTSIIIATKFWDTLDSNTQQIMKDAALDAARTERRESVAQIEDIIKDCAERNVPVVKMDQTETEKFIEATSVVYEKYQDYFSTDLISQIQQK
jgi:TRAP-type C4-dicarboxylate transport system substrate-binding protein